MSPETLFEQAIISPYNELIAYEILYAQNGATLKRMAAATVGAGRLPSEALQEQCGLIDDYNSDSVKEYMAGKLGNFAIAINNTPSWPNRLADSERPVPLIYYRGDIGLLDSPTVSVVGARKASPEGLARASRIARELSANGVTVATGLAAGVDSAATRAAIEASGNVVGVIGTPIDECYPKENETLQNEVASRHLLISQVPFYHYAHQSFKSKRYYFPERNELMAAISNATVIVEASDTSGTRSQARACMQQGRPLFIMRSLAEDSAIGWTDYYIEKGAIVLDDVSQILSVLAL